MQLTKNFRTVRSIIAALATGLASAYALAAPPLVDIGTLPLYGSQQAHPNVAVSMSVEFPTVGSAFRDQSVRRYDRGQAYLGYFDSGRCYNYVPGPDGYFTPSGIADANHECVNQFSGSFMNFITMSAIDEFRYAMTGGNRWTPPVGAPVPDAGDPVGASGAILERANLPDGSAAAAGLQDFYSLLQQYPSLTMSDGAMQSQSNVDSFSAVNPSNITDVTYLPGTARTDVVYVHNCLTKVFFGTNGGGNCQNPDNSRGEFNVRVFVCGPDPAAGTPGEGSKRIDLCKNYGTAAAPIYKPVGEAQRNADKMRFAAFGYLLDRTYVSSYCNYNNGQSDVNRCRYGGVLRAPMKYLGPTSYDKALVPNPSNPTKEINADGTFVNDPFKLDPLLNAASAGGTYSGFINYINKFGSKTALYKTYDPMGEMYYEAIRYYQGMQPTDLAIDPAPNSSLGNDTKDYFPVSTTWTDPILARCASNYIINISDANTWDDSYIPGAGGNPLVGLGRPSTRGVAGGLNAVTWTRKIGDLESSVSAVSSAWPTDHDPNLYHLDGIATGSGNNATYFAAGVAYWANTNDIRTDLDGRQTVKTISIDVAELTPSLPLYERQLYLMGKYGGFNDTEPFDQNPFFTAPSVRSNAEWADSTNSPTNYLLASDPSRLISGLRNAFARITESTGTATGASLTSSNLVFGGGADAYVATFNSSKWSGNVLRKLITVDSVGNTVVTKVTTWDPAKTLDAKCGTPQNAATTCKESNADPLTKRKIFTTNGGPGSRNAVEFALAKLDQPYIAAILGNTRATTAQQRVDYLRGYRGDEGSNLNLRSRDSALGDIINSGPTYVGAPTSAIPDADYETRFFNLNLARPPAVYVGANDGMLHAFDASTTVGGQEFFAYIPGYSKGALANIYDPAYTHATFVDTTPKIQEAKVGADWKTVLVGANGGGAQGVFALDVSNPSTFKESNVLFEFSDEDDPDFGNVVAAPEIAKLQVGVLVGNIPDYRYFAVVTGYNERRSGLQNGTTDTHTSTQTDNRGYLFLLSLDHQLGATWVQGANDGYFKFTFPAIDKTTSRNGLGPVTLLPSRTGDRSTTALYFGDLQGQLWRFNTAPPNNMARPTPPYSLTGSWKSAIVNGTVPAPIFRAHDDAGNRQPITERPEISNGPFPDSTLLFFGTGSYLGPDDTTGASVTATQSQYAILDTTSTTPVEIVRDVLPSSSDLVVRTATAIPGGNGGNGAIRVSGTSFKYSGANSKKGWYLDFKGIGERSINKPALRTGLLTFDTLTLDGNVCDPGGGFIYQLDALSGLEFPNLYAGYASTVGIPGPPQVVDLGVSTYGTDRGTGEQINMRRQTTMVGGTKGTIDSTRDLLGNQAPYTGKAPPIGRVSWREISNWNDKTNH